MRARVFFWFILASWQLFCVFGVYPGILAAVLGPGNISLMSRRCPITLSVMREPAQASSGLTYERSAIFKWLEQHRCACCPDAHVC